MKYNHALFDAFKSDFTVVPSQIVARECLAILTTPLLEPFLQQIKQRGESWASTLLDQLTGRFGWEAPTVWSVGIDDAEAPALMDWLRSTHAPPPLGNVLLSPYDRTEELGCRALYLVRADNSVVTLPPLDTPVQIGDQWLLVGRSAAQRDLALTLSNENTLKYVLQGREIPGGWVWEKLAQLRTRSPD